MIYYTVPQASRCRANRGRSNRLTQLHVADAKAVIVPATRARRIRTDYQLSSVVIHCIGRGHRANARKLSWLHARRQFRPNECRDRPTCHRPDIEAPVGLRRGQTRRHCPTDTSAFDRGTRQTIRRGRRPIAPAMPNPSHLERAAAVSFPAARMRSPCSVRSEVARTAWGLESIARLLQLVNGTPARRPKEPCRVNELSSQDDRDRTHPATGPRSGYPCGSESESRPALRRAPPIRHKRASRACSLRASARIEAVVRAGRRCWSQGGDERRRPPNRALLLSPRSKRVRPGLGTTAFVLVPTWAALSQRWHEQ